MSEFVFVVGAGKRLSDLSKQYPAGSRIPIKMTGYLGRDNYTLSSVEAHRLAGQGYGSIVTVDGLIHGSSSQGLPHSGDGAVSTTYLPRGETL